MSRQMQLVANFTDETAPPARWAAQREAEGFDLIGCPDHFWTSRTYPHLWVTLTEQALATSTIGLTSSFANNLFRSPVEFAQAALSLQRVSGGRYEAGLGAGWDKTEVTGAGLTYPEGPERARRYLESVRIVRELLHTGRCTLDGRELQVDVPMLGPALDEPVPPPPLVVSVSGPWVIRYVTPLADRVELNLAGRATRGGGMDLAVLGEIDADEIRRAVDAVREAAPDVPIGAFALTGTGDHPRVAHLSGALGNSLFGGFFGEPKRVAENLLAVGDLGFDRLQITELAPGSLTALAPHLIGAPK